MKSIILAGSTRFIKSAPLSRRKDIDFMPVHMYNLTVDALKKIGKTPAGSKVAILGWASIIRMMPGTRHPSRTGICFLMPGAV